MFRTVTSQVNFPQLEKSILGVWQKNNTFTRSVDARRGSSRFVFYEGPPTTNGSPGIHHVLARVFKDVILRYRTMKGNYLPRIAGWDTHGLPVELEVEGKLGEDLDMLLGEPLDTWTPEARGSSARVFEGFLHSQTSSQTPLAIKIITRNLTKEC